MDRNEQELNYKEFYEVYKNKVVSRFGEFEDVRHALLDEYKRKKRILCASFLILGLLYLLTFIIAKFTDLFLYYYLEKEFFIALVFATSIAFFVVVRMVSDKNKIAAKYKEMINKKDVRECFMQGLNLEWKKHNPQELAKDSDATFDCSELHCGGLFVASGKQYIDDEFKGSYKGVEFKVSEVEIKKYEREKGSYGNVTIFKGVIIDYLYNKNIKNRTIVSTKWNFTQKQSDVCHLLLSLVPGIGLFASDYTHAGLIFIVIFFVFVIKMHIEFKQSDLFGEPMNKVTLEYPIFNKRFDVYSADEIEARYLVTPLFMELLNNLKTAFGAKVLKCSFFNYFGQNRFMIAISTKKDLFEIGNINTSFDNPKHITQFYRELKSIYAMIEYFKLDKNRTTY